MYSGYCHVNFPFVYEAFTLSGWLSQNHSTRIIESFMQSEPHDARIMVWALPRSLAATYGIEFSFFSSGYLDVSVPRVPRLSADQGLLDRVSPFRDLRINGYLPLPEAYRSLSRLSSALSAKASALRPYCLTFRSPF